MTYFNPPRRRSPFWPLAAMTFLVGLLATFLVVQMLKKDDPGIAGPTTPPVVAPPPTTKAAPPPSAAPKLPGQTAASRLLQQAKQEIAAGHLKEASDLVAQARKLDDTPEARAVEKTIAEALQQQAAAEEIARRELERQKEEREKLARIEREMAAERDRLRQEQLKREEDERQAKMAAANAELNAANAAFDVLKVEVLKLEKEYRWDAAVKLGTDILTKHSALRTVQAYNDLMRKITESQKDAQAVVREAIEKAKKEIAAGQHREAFKRVDTAVKQFYPEHAEGLALMRKTLEDMHLFNMVRITVPKEGMALGDKSKTNEPERVFKGASFLLDKFEVTNDEYAVFVSEKGAKAPPSRYWPGGQLIKDAGKFPVTNVTAAEAAAYAKWAGKRLPTEDEWEAAARGPFAYQFPWGNDFREEPALANTYESSQKADMKFAVKPVGSYPTGQNPFFLVQDMAGNVWEWTSTEEGKLRVLKGGSFMTPKDTARSANRFLDDPELAHHDVGFRCAKDLPKDDPKKEEPRKPHLK